MSKMNIRGSEYPIKKIFNDDFVFTIPLYQRAYSWTTEQSEELYQDLLRATEGGDKPAETDDLAPYFLGSIVLIKGDEPDAQVIDGQQRLTTLTMLLAAIRSLISSNYADSLTSFLCEKGNVITCTPERYRLRLRDRDAAFFQKYVQEKGGIEALQELQDAQLPESQRNIRANTLGFIRELQKLSDAQLNAHAFNNILKTNYQLGSATKAKEINTMFKWLNHLDHSQWVPPALYYFVKNHRKQPDLVLRFLSDLERLVISFIVCRVPPYKRVDRYCDLLHAIDEDVDLFNSESPLQLRVGERLEFLKVLDGDIYLLHYPCRYVLLRLDTKLSEKVASYDHQTVTIEHVLPQHPSPESEWIKAFPSREIRQKYVNRLGNLVLLSQGKNMIAANYDFEEKKRKYFFSKESVSPFALTTQVLSVREWKPTTIEQRQSQLITVLKQLWRL